MNRWDRIATAFQNKTHKEYDSWVNTVDPSVIGGVQIKTKSIYRWNDCEQTKTIQREN